MDENTPANPLISVVLTFEDASRRIMKTSAKLFNETLEFEADGFSRTIRLGDVVSVLAEQYKITIAMQHETIVLSMIGHWYEDLAKQLIRACNEVFFEQLLMREKVHFEARGQYIAPAGVPEPALFRVLETALAVLPDAHALVRIPFCMVQSKAVEPYCFRITDKQGRVYTLQKLGRITDKFLSEYEQRYAALVKQTTDRLGEIAPVSESLAQLMMEGLVTPVKRIRALSPEFADALEKHIVNSQIAREYAYIKSVSSDMAVGIKRGLMGQLTGESIILLAPSSCGKRIIMESLGASAATYVFNRAPNTSWDQFLPLFNESMLAVNFRREPIYLSDEALEAEKYETYRYAVLRCPALVRLRAQFAGRVKHSGFETWKNALGAYIE